MVFFPKFRRGLKIKTDKKRLRVNVNAQGFDTCKKIETKNKCDLYLKTFFKFVRISIFLLQ